MAIAGGEIRQSREWACRRRPSLAPELNPVERVWLYLKERFLSHRLLADYDAIVNAACDAWNKLVAEAGRIKSLCSYPWIPEVNP